MNYNNDMNNKPQTSSNAPCLCPECGEWLNGEELDTCDEDAYKGKEDWRYCPACEYEAFYPLFLIEGDVK